MRARTTGAMFGAAAVVAAMLAMPAAAAAADPVIAAAGNIACDPTNPSFNGGNGSADACQEMATSNLLVGQNDAAVLALGDNQYEDGSSAQFAASYDPSWGRLKAITHPVPGNHEYQTAGASGYYGYFGSSAGTAGQGYYSYDVGAWHLIALNSNCTIVAGGCAAGSPQETWLRQDLAAHANSCVLAYWHHPAFSSGEDGDNPITTAFWNDLYNAGADIVLNGHAHEYERFAPQTPSGTVDNTYGITEFVDGTGGDSYEPAAPRAANSLVLEDGVFGVMQLTLHAGSADYKFNDIRGAFTDSGTVTCHGAPPVTTPSAPTSVAGTTGDGQATVSWTPPSSTVSSYTVTASPGGATVSVSGTQPVATITGLTNGTAYTFTVTATNSAGTSPSSSPSSPVTPRAAPTGADYRSQVLRDAPAGYWPLDESSTSATVADASGNSHPGSYSGGVSLGQAGAIATGTGAAFDGSTGAANISDASPLRLNGPFTIEFWAKSSAFANSWPGLLRKGAAGTADGYVIWYTSNGTLHFKRNNLDVPTPSGSLTSTYRHFALVDDGSTATWYVNGKAVASQPMSVPTDNGTDPLVIGQGDQAGNQTMDEVAVYNSALSASRVAAHYAAASVSGTTTAPGAPTGVTATAGNASATVHWTAPASNGGSAITGYTVTSSGGQTATVSGTTTSATVTGLTNGTSYTFTVTATNAVGTSPASATSNAVTPTAPTSAPDAPTGVTATGGNASATVSWTAPASNGGSAITGYTVTSTGGQTATVSGATTTATVTGLTNGTSYTFTVTATNAVGTGPASVPSNAVTPTAPTSAPGAPTGVTATAGNASATVHWTAPASNGGSTITGYTVTSSGGQTTTVSGSTTTATVTGLANGTSYTFTVTATNAIGTSPASAASNAVTPSAPATAPAAPTAVTAAAGSGYATVSWTAPSSNGGSTITGYTVTASGGQTATVSGTTTTATIAGLTNGTSYTFTVTATNAIGTSPASAPSNAVTPTAAPAGYATTVLADNPIGYWRLGESSGTTAADASGHGLSGTYVGGVTLGRPGALPDDTNTAVAFNGSTGCVNIGDTAALRLNGAFTIEFWARMQTFVNTWPGLLMKGPSATASGYLVWYSSNGTLHFKRNNVDIATPAGALSSTTWKAFAISYDGSTVRWYVNGQLVASKAVAFPTNTGTSPLQLGRGDQFGSELIDEVALYSTALTPTRIGAHYSAA